MRILFVSPVGVLGGAERSLLDLIASVKQQAPRCQVEALLFADGPLVEALAGLGISVHVLPLPACLASWGEWRADGGGRARAPWARRLAAGLLWLRQLWILLRRFRRYVLHTNGYKAHMAVSLVKPGRAPMIWHIRDFVSTRRFSSRFLRAMSWRCRGIIAVSSAVADDCRVALPGVKAIRVYDAIALAEGERAAVPAGWERRPLVGFVATFAHWKGQDVFLRIAGALRRRCPDAGLGFVIVGGPIYAASQSQFTHAELHALAEEAEVADAVLFTGFVPDAMPWMRRFCLYVHCSRSAEPFGRTIVEAMSAGVPVLVADAGGAAELVDHGVSGFRIRPGDVDGYVERALQVLCDPALSQRLASAGQAHACRSFDRQRLAFDTLRAYRQLGVCDEGFAQE